MEQVVRYIPTEHLGTLAAKLPSLFPSEFAGKRVAVKLHMGEYGNLHYLRPSLVGCVVEALQRKGSHPFLFDTPVWYAGSRRRTVDQYIDTARRNGFTPETVGCPITIAERFTKVESGSPIGDVLLPQELLDAGGLLVLSHFKGHDGAFFGGAIKNLGMGCVGVPTKEKMHTVLSQPVIDQDKCVQCGTCVDACPLGALSFVDDRLVLSSETCEGCGACGELCPEGAIASRVANLRQLLAQAASVVLGQLEGKPQLFVNAMLDITAGCDCVDLPGPRICDDLGYMIACSAVAADKASVDLLQREIGEERFRALRPMKPLVQLEVARDLGVGSLEYELVKL